MIKKILGIILVILFSTSLYAANFYWKDTKSGLDGISGAASGDRGVVIDTNGIMSFYLHNGTQWNLVSVTGGIINITKSSAYTLGTSDIREAYGGMVTATATMTLTLPEVVASNPTSSQVTQGASFCGMVIGAYTLTIDPNANDGIILTDSSGTRGTNGNYISNTSAATGDMICLFADSASGWTTLGSRGTWAAQ